MADFCSCGTYHIVDATGFECKGGCWWCGGELPVGRHRHYCSSFCSKQYHSHFLWSIASAWAMERARYKCQNCGVPKQNISCNGGTWEGGYKTNLEVHHIIPMNGADRFISILNVPCNLLVLCHDCHWSENIHGKKQSTNIPKEQLKFTTIEV